MTRLLLGGLTTFDLAYFVEELPVRGRKGTANASYTAVGGPVANAAIAVAMLGSSAELHSVFGTDMFADRVRSELAGFGVATMDHADGTNLPVASVWIDGAGERTILSTDNKRAEVQARRNLIDMSDVDAVLLDGHYPQLQVALAETAVAAGVPIVLDCGRWRSVFAELLPSASDLIMTATFRPPGMESLSEAEAVAAIYQEYQPELCAMSRGAAPILAATTDGLVEVPVPAVEVVDTTGAGDILHGAYVHHRYGQGLSAFEAMREAAAAASASCRRVGARLAGESPGDAD